MKDLCENLKLVPDLRQEIRAGKDDDFKAFRSMKLSKVGSDFREGENRTLYFRDRIYVSKDETLRKQILIEAHKSKYTIHSREVMMYKDLKRVYW
jgi:hypothetical protein